MAYPTGFEPATSRVGVLRAIQLCHGQKCLMTPLLYQKKPDKSICNNKKLWYCKIFLKKPIAFCISLWYNIKAVKKICRCDGIGRRAGLKIQSWRQGAGSTPATGTIKKKQGCKTTLFFYFLCVSTKRGQTPQNRKVLIMFCESKTGFWPPP